MRNIIYCHVQIYFRCQQPFESYVTNGYIGESAMELLEFGRSIIQSAMELLCWIRWANNVEVVST
jgi:hypothetical protein